MPRGSPAPPSCAASLEERGREAQRQRAAVRTALARRRSAQAWIAAGLILAWILLVLWANVTL